MISINNNKKKEKKNLIKHNQITKLKKKLFFDPNWKINKNNKNNKNKNEINIQNYKARNKYE